MNEKYVLWVTAQLDLGLSTLAARVANMDRANRLAEAAGLTVDFERDSNDMTLAIRATDLPSLITLATQLSGDWQHLVIDKQPDDEGGDIEAMGVLEWHERLQAGMTRRIHVVSFSPATEEHSAGGFDWFPNLDDAKLMLAQRVLEETDSQGMFNLSLVHVDVPAILSRDEVTDYLDSNMDLFEPLGMLKYKTEKPLAA